MISPQSIEEIKQKLDIIDVIGDYVKLKKRGANYLGNCPFHNEKTPSFTVSPSKELFKCFGCGKSGNTISFIMEHDKLSYVETLKVLAARYNITIEETEVSAEKKEQYQVADSLYVINKFAAKFFQEQLYNSTDEAYIALSYLKERGFSNDTLTKFEIGYNSADKNKLAQALIQNQFNKDYFSKTGLVVERNQEWQDNYRNRIIFPIHQINGKVVGFGARVIGKGDNKSPKYINTPENEIYVKNKLLYGLFQAKTAIGKLNECLLTEGYTDVISLHQASVENVVASGGTSLTTEQLRLIKKYTNNLCIMYDGDQAGIKAALRGVDMALEEGLNVSVLLFPDNEDPDSYIKKYGKDAFHQMVSTQKKDIIIFQTEIMMKEAGNNISQKNAVVNQLAETLSKINKPEDFVKLNEYIKQSTKILDIDEAALTSLVSKLQREKQLKSAEKNQSLNKTTSSNITNTAFEAEQEQIPAFDQNLYSNKQEDDLEKTIVKLLFEHGDKLHPVLHISYAQYLFKEIEEFPLEHPTWLSMYEAYKANAMANNYLTIDWIKNNSNAEIQQLAADFIFNQYEPNYRWFDEKSGLNTLPKDNAYNEVILSICYYKLKRIKKWLEHNFTELQQAAPSRQMQHIEIHQHLKALEKEVTQLMGTVILK